MPLEFAGNWYTKSVCKEYLYGKLFTKLGLFANIATAHKPGRSQLYKDCLYKRYIFNRFAITAY